MKTRGNAFHLEFSAPPTKAPLLRGLYFSSTSLQYLIDANPLISHLICAHVNTHALEISDGHGRSAKRLFPFHSEGTNSIFFARSFDLCAVAKRPSANPYTAGAKVALFV